MSHTSETTDGESLAPPRVLHKPAQHEPVPDFDMQSLEEVKRSEPKKYSDAELYKLNTLFPAIEDQSREHSTGGTTAVDRNSLLNVNAFNNNSITKVPLMIPTTTSFFAVKIHWKATLQLHVSQSVRRFLAQSDVT